jgi:hypothetical protein
MSLNEIDKAIDLFVPLWLVFPFENPEFLGLRCYMLSNDLKIFPIVSLWKENQLGRRCFHPSPRPARYHCHQQSPEEP